MTRDYNFRYESNLEDIIKVLKRRGPSFVAIDGRDGSGKTFLGNHVTSALGGTHLTESDYRYDNKDGLFHVNSDVINKDLRNAARPVVLDCCFLQEILPKLKIKPDLIIYTKSLETNSGKREEGEELYSNEEEPSKFRQQMKDYHKRFRPDKLADITYWNRLIIE